MRKNIEKLKNIKNKNLAEISKIEKLW